jgi:hypothetical protein
MTEGQAEQIERIVDGLAAALFAGALGYALFTLRRGACAEPQTGLLSAVAAGLAFLFCFRLLTPIAPEPRRFEMRQIDLRPIEQTDELLLTEPVELLLTEQVELVLTDVDRLQPQETHGRDELVLDDILGDAARTPVADRPSMTPMSATIRSGMLNSASASPAHMRSTIASECGGKTRSAKTWRSPVKVKDCQSVDCNSVSKILSRGTPARAISARSRLEAAADMAIFSMTLPPADKRSPSRRFADAVRVRCEDRRRNADRQGLPCRIGWERCRAGEETSPLL